MLTVIRTSSTNSLERKIQDEDTILMFCVLKRTEDGAGLELKATSSPVVRYLREELNKGRINGTDTLYYLYKHGGSPEGIYITVKEFSEWLGDTAIDIAKARISCFRPTTKEEAN